MRSKELVILGMLGIVLLGGVAPVAAHGWQSEVTVGDMELGMSSTPETPVAGMQTDFSARIMDNGSLDGEADRLSWGGVTNRSVEIHIRGPDGYHDHLETEIPEDDAHFHFSYVFPTHGNYSIAVVTEIEGEEYSFQLTKEVVLLPSEPRGDDYEQHLETTNHLHENHEALNEDIASISSDVASTKSEVGEVHDNVDALSQQVSDLKDQVAALESQDENADQEPANALGFGVTAVLAAFVATIAFIAGRRL